MKLSHTSLILLVFVTSTAFSQATVAFNDTKNPVRLVKAAPAASVAAPQFKGGENALSVYISENLEYPKQAIRKGQEGTVIVSYYINTDGSIEQVEIAQSVSKELDEAALRFVNKMPRWIPAIQNNQPQRVKYRLPITYNLDF